MRYFLFATLSFALTGCFLRSKSTSLFEDKDLYLPEQYGPAVERLDTIDGNPVVITEYKEKKGNVYSRSVKLSETMRADTFYYPNGKYYAWRVSKLCENPTDHLYDSLVNQQYDKKGRAQLRITALYHEADTTYLQYFDESGVLQTERHPVIFGVRYQMENQN